MQNGVVEPEEVGFYRRSSLDLAGAFPFRWQLAGQVLTEIYSNWM
ncbi:hypothetical protein LINGRAHAP2_LOCUS10505 [Linum grandiflorum]